jgi:nucleotide-binding universal stress UspA family protein
MIALKHILVATDFGEAAETALTYGRALARTFGATLHVLHVTSDIYMNAVGVDMYTASANELQRDLDETARKELQELVLDRDSTGTTTVPAILTSGSPALTIVQYAKNKDIDLIVMGTHGRGPVAHMVMGSVAERVVRLAPCPVLTVRHPEHEFVTSDAMIAASRVPA